MSGKIKTKSNKNDKIISALIIIGNIIFLSFISFVISFVLLYKDTIHTNIYVESINVSGLTVIEAADKVEGKLKDNIQEEKLQLRYGSKVWTYDSKDIDIKYNFRKAINEAYFIGRKGNYLERISRILMLFKEPESISIESSVDINKINSILDNIAKEINQSPIDATIKRQEGKFIINEGKIGYQLDKENTISKIQEKLGNSGYFDTVVVDLIVKEIYPKTTAEILNTIDHLLGSYTTEFNSSVVGRSHNIKLASNAIDGTVLLPGDVFSFNDIVGPRTPNNGYKTAPVIFKGELVDGIGGGVCQVSSTIYNSVLRSRLEIVERTNHSIPSTYVPKGLDATVSYGVLDFKFKNSTEYPIYIESYVSGNKLTVNIYGQKTSNREIKFTSEVDDVIKRKTEVIYDSNMYEGQEIVKEKGRDGYRVSTYMIEYENGREIRREKISYDYYRPKNRVVIRGTKKQNKSKNDEDKDGNDDNKVNNIQRHHGDVQ